MLYDVNGDILLSQAQAIAHGVAPDDHFTSGLALGLREQWPSMSRDFRHWCHQTNPKSGKVWLWSGVGNHRIFCLLTQEAAQGHSHPGRATIENVNHCLHELRHHIEREKITSLAIPRLATGVGGLDWTEVNKLIHHHLATLAIPVFVYTGYSKGVAAKEPGLPPAQKATT